MSRDQTAMEKPSGPPTSETPGRVEQIAFDKQRWPRQFAEITGALEDELRRLEAPYEPGEARRIACRLTAGIARRCGGTVIYLPTTRSIDRLIRDNWLWAEYDGTVEGPRGISALSRETGITTIGIYRILAQQRAIHRRGTAPGTDQETPL